MWRGQKKMEVIGIVFWLGDVLSPEAHKNALERGEVSLASRQSSFVQYSNGIHGVQVTLHEVVIRQCTPLSYPIASQLAVPTSFISLEPKDCSALDPN